MDTQIFLDIADKLNLKSPAFIEKDYFGIQLLKLITEVKLDNWELCFAGGTCLSKAHLKNLSRMSEDIDIKFIAKPGVEELSNNKKRNHRKLLKNDIIKYIQDAGNFRVIDSRSRNEGSSRCFFVEYPQEFKHFSLRAELKLEFTEVKQYWAEPLISSVGSIYAREMQQEDEILNLSCDALEVILVEKLVSLLRRTAQVARKCESDDDEALVRHIYDLYFICNHEYDINKSKCIALDVLENDKRQFGNKHIEFSNNPGSELLYGLKILSRDEIHKDRYEKFLGPLVYSPNPPSWQEGLENIKELASIVLDQ